MRHPAHRLAASALAIALCAAVPAAAAPPLRDWNPVIDPAKFTSAVDNPYFPLPVGARWVYRGETKDGLETLEVEVRPGTKFILGVATTIVFETASIDGEVVEIAENWFAQDEAGDVWYFGEFTQDFAGGVPVGTAGSWEAGIGDALPGIVMKAEPKRGDTYFQEYAPGIAEDRATVMSTGGGEAVSYGVFADVVTTREWTKLESNSVERKSYARGIGLILEKKGGARLELVEMR